MKKLLLFFVVGILAVACNPNEENPPITPPESEQPPQSPYLHIYHQNATPEGYENKHKHNGENHLYYDENYQGYTYPYQSGYDTFMVETNIQTTPTGEQIVIIKQMMVLLITLNH